MWLTGIKLLYHYTSASRRGQKVSRADGKIKVLEEHGIEFDPFSDTAQIYLASLTLSSLTLSLLCWGKLIKVCSGMTSRGQHTTGAPIFLSTFFFYNFIFLLYNIVLVLPYIDMDPPQVYMSSQSWTPLPPPSPYHLSESSQCTSPKHPVSCMEPRLAIRFLHDSIHASMPFSQIIPPSPSPTESKRLFYTSVSLVLSHIQACRYHLSKFHIYALVYCIGVFLSGLLHSV